MQVLWKNDTGEGQRGGGGVTGAVLRHLGTGISSAD